MPNACQHSQRRCGVLLSRLIFAALRTRGRRHDRSLRATARVSSLRWCGTPSRGPRGGIYPRPPRPPAPPSRAKVALPPLGLFTHLERRSPRMMSERQPRQAPPAAEARRTRGLWKCATLTGGWTPFVRDGGDACARPGGVRPRGVRTARGPRPRKIPPCRPQVPVRPPVRQWLRYQNSGAFSRFQRLRQVASHPLRRTRATASPSGAPLRNQRAVDLMSSLRPTPGGGGPEPAPLLAGLTLESQISDGGRGEGGGGGDPGAREPPLPAVGARVRCKGLTGAAELNGCLGRVVSHEGVRRRKCEWTGPAASWA